MPKWTPEQEQAIESRGANLLVSAAAGSGKTAVLVERIIRLVIEDQTDIDRMLIVTFTNAAAGEMRERILGALVKALEEKRGEEAFLRRQIGRLSRAYIMTVHAYCIDVVRRHFYEADLDPSFRIGDTSELSLMLDEALELVMEEAYAEGNPTFHKLVESYGSGRTDDKLRELLLKLYFFIQSKPEPIQWLKDQAAVFEKAAENLDETDWARLLMEIAQKELASAEDILASALIVCEHPDGPIEYAKTVGEDSAQLTDLREAARNGFSSLYAQLESLKHPRLATIKKARKELVDPVLVDEVKDLRDIYKKKIIKPLQDLVCMKEMDAHRDDARALAPMMAYVATIIERLHTLYDGMKREQNLLDFNDLEHYAISILKNKDIAKSYRDRFDYIFMDEYQDSNIVQETIVGSIKRDNNLFLVGDVKQSIYRFRLADPSLFLDKYRSYGKEEGSVNRRIDLSRNFRSRDQILYGTNEIFHALMTEAFGEMNYDAEAALYPGLSFEPAEEPANALLVLDGAADEGLEDEDLKEMKAAQLEATAIAQQIRRLVGTPTYDGKAGQWRNIRFGDIVVLLRATRSWSGIFHDVFSKAGIPLYTDAGAGYFDALEVEMFISLLRLLDNRAQDLPLLTVLRSPFGQFTTEELIDIRLRSVDGGFHEAFLAVTQEEDALGQKAAAFWERLDDWADTCRYTPLNEFLWQLLMETGFYYYVGAMPGGGARQANLRLLVDKAGQVQRHNASGLFHFLRYVDRLKQTSGDLGAAAAVGEHEDVVRLMSIHKSKGLEFPVVIIGGMGRRFNLRDTQENLLLHKDIGLGPKFVDPDKRIWSPTLSQAVMKHQMKEESLAEEMRILYVAMTRAVDRLILVGTTSRLESSLKKWSRGPGLYHRKACGSYLDWVGTILTQHPDGAPLRELAENGDQAGGGQWQSRWTVQVLRKDQVLSEQKGSWETGADESVGEDASPEAKQGSGDLEWIRERFNWSYPYEKSVNLPYKLAVSDLKRAKVGDLETAGVHIPKLIPQPQFIAEKRAMTAAERGTLHHFVMQHLNVRDDVSVKGVRRQVEGMVLRNLIDPEDGKHIAADQIAALFQTQLGKRMLETDKLHREVPFIIQTDVDGENVLVQGIIDCYFEETDGLVLVDYKTDFTGIRGTEQVADQYRIQLQLYKQALEELLEKPVKEAHVYFFDAAESVKLDLS